MLNPTGVIRNEIDENFLKVAVLSRSTKGTMTSPFLRAPCSQFSIRCSTRCSQKFHKIHRKTTQACDFIKKEQARNQRGEEGGLPCPFSKNRKKVPNLRKTCPDCGHLQVKFFIYNAIFKSFQEKKPEIYSCGAILSRFVHYQLSKCPNSKKTPLP